MLLTPFLWIFVNLIKKSLTICLWSRCRRSFNRYMVECEFNFSGKMAQMSTVLIDTWWNVNEWLASYNEHSASFNRYMVECESTKEFVRVADIPF